MKYYLVTAKCGHVGRNHYYEGKFPIQAESAKEAAQRVRLIGRVKHDHTDAILNVEKIDEEVYYYYLEDYENQVYFRCNSKKEQELHWDEILPYVYEETESAINRLSKHNDYYKNTSRKKGIRNPYKYAKYNYYIA